MSLGDRRKLRDVIQTSGLSLSDAFRLSMTINSGPLRIHISSQDRDKPPGAHAARIRPAHWRALLQALDRRSADLMMEARDKELAALPLLRSHQKTLLKA